VILNLEHYLKICNLLHVLVHCEQKRLQGRSEVILANSRVSYVNGQRIHTDGPATEIARGNMC